MASNIPTWISVILIISQFLIAAAVWAGFQRTARSLPAAGRQEGTFASLRMGVFLAVWLSLAVILGMQGFFRPDPTARVPNLVYTLVPLVLGYIWLSRSGRMQQVLAAVPPHWMIAVQLYRTLGVVFLILYAQNQLPAEFALPAGVGDVLIGLSAPIVAWLYSTRPGSTRWLAILWNLVGIADLLLAVTLGFLTSPSRYQLLAMSAPNQLITAFPLVLIPVFAVPLSILLHLFSLRAVVNAAK